MSSKVNISEIITGHFKTLQGDNGKYLKLDILTFMIIPILLGVTSASLSFNLNKDISSLLVNFGSIFTALLLSVLVLVYDQESKIEDKKETDGFYKEKKKLLKQLYYNISYSILCSVALVFFCFIQSIILGVESQIQVYEIILCIKYDELFVTPVVVVIAANLFLNILMIVKRMHTLLITQ